MHAQSADQVVLERFREKCRAAGGPRPGYVLRRRAILLKQEDQPNLDLEEGIATLLEQGIVKASESGDFIFLTAAGVEILAPSGNRPEGETEAS